MDKETIELIVGKLDTAEDELLYASTTGNDSNRDFYIKNAMRFIREAMEMLK
jgi:hypothetical protein